jgi:hypothetical protein
VSQWAVYHRNAVPSNPVIQSVHIHTAFFKLSNKQYVIKSDKGAGLSPAGIHNFGFAARLQILSRLAERKFRQ